MGVSALEVGYTSATTRRGDHEVHKGHVVALGEKKVLGRRNFQVESSQAVVQEHSGMADTTEPIPSAGSLYTLRQDQRSAQVGGFPASNTQKHLAEGNDKAACLQQAKRHEYGRITNAVDRL
jgi:hypothetical protein